MIAAMGLERRQVRAGAASEPPLPEGLPGMLRLLPQVESCCVPWLSIFTSHSVLADESFNPGEEDDDVAEE